MPQATHEYIHLDMALCTFPDEDSIGVVGFERAEILFEQRVVQEVGRQLYRLVEVEGLTRLVLNLENIQYLSSAMLANLVGLKKRIDRVQGQLKICGLNPVVRDSFRTARLLEIFEVYDDELTALDHF